MLRSLRMQTERRWWLVAGLLLFVDFAKQAALLSLGQEQPWGDSDVYWRLGTDVATGDWWLARSGLAFRTPGYLWFLGSFRCMAGSATLITVAIVQHLLAMLTSVFTGMLAGLWSRSARWGLLAYAGCVVMTARDLYANWVLTETLATFLLITTLLLLAIAMRTADGMHWTLAGACLGLGILVRPSLVALVPVLGVGAGLLFVDRERRVSRGVLLRCGMLAVMMTGLMLLPWCCRNSWQFQRFTLCVFTGRELWTTAFSPWPGAELPIPEDGPGAEVRSRLRGLSVNLRHQWSVSALLTESGMNDAEVDQLMEHVALQGMWRQPVRVLSRFLVRCGTFWYAWEWPAPWDDIRVEQQQLVFGDQQLWSDKGSAPVMNAFLAMTPERHRASSVLYSLAALLACLRLCLISRTRTVGCIVATAFVAFTVLTAALEIPLYRYRCVLEPVMMVTLIVAVADRRASRAARGRDTDRSAGQSSAVRSD